MNKYFIGISISELQQWLADDELPVTTDRITHSSGSSPVEASLSDHELDNLFKFLPAFSLDDTAGVLIVEISCPKTWKADDNPNIRHLSLSDVKKFIPLTDDSKIALSSNLSRVIQISEAIFEQQFTRFRISKKSISACNAGNLFVNIFIDHNPTKFAATDFFAKALPRALMAAEHRNPNEIEKLSRIWNDELQETWVERVFGDIKKYDKDNKLSILRKKPDNIQDIGSIGLILSTVEEAKIITDNFRSIYKKLEVAAKNNDQSLAFVYADSELSQLKLNFNVYSEASESISLITLGLFLRWKRYFHDERSTVNADLILNDVDSLTGLVDVELVANALWMMGAYLGMENITPTYRHLHQDRYPALRFSTKDNFLKPITAWPQKETQLSADQGLSPHSVQDSETAKTPEHESASDINTATSEIQQPEQQQQKETQPESEQVRSTDGVDLPTDESKSIDAFSAIEAPIISNDEQIPSDQKWQQTDNEVIEPPEGTTDPMPTLPMTEHGTFENLQNSTTVPIQASKNILQAAPSTHPVSGDKIQDGSAESLQETSSSGQSSPTENPTPAKPPKGRNKGGKRGSNVDQTQQDLLLTASVPSSAEQPTPPLTEEK